VDADAEAGSIPRDGHVPQPARGVHAASTPDKQSAQKSFQARVDAEAEAG